MTKKKESTPKKTTSVEKVNREAKNVVDMTFKSPVTASKAKPNAKSSKKAASAIVETTINPVESSLCTQFNLLSAEKLFEELCDADDPETIGSDGIVRLCEFLGIDPQDKKTLMLMWRLGACKKPGLITKEEWVQGLAKIRKRNLAELRKYMPFLDSGFLSYEEYRDFFHFTHTFSREGTKKTLEKDMVEALLPIVLDEQRAPHLKCFMEFMAAPESAEFTHISIDSWDSFYVFNRMVPLDLAEFDAGGSWPTILDQFVAWRRACVSDAVLSA